MAKHNITERAPRWWRRLFLVIGLIAAFVVVPVHVGNARAAVQDTFYASPTGSGSTCSQVSPCSITGARDKVRTVNVSMTGDIVVYLLAGEYPVSSTIAFTEVDSGTNGFHISYKSHGALGSVRFLGGQAVTGWSVFSGNVYRASVGTAWAFNDLFENGERSVKARTPNINTDYGLTTTAQGPWLKNEAYSDTSQTTFQFKAGDLDPSGWATSHMQVNIFSGGYYNWNQNLIGISSVDAANRRITLNSGTDYGLTANGRYFVQGDLSLLDAPGEYFLDRAGGYLYYYPRSLPLTDQSVVAPTVTDVFRFVGASEAAPVKNIRLEGVTIEYSDYVDSDPQYSRANAMVFLKNVEGIEVVNSHLRNAGLSGIAMFGYAKGNRVYGNWIEKSGVSGVSVMGHNPTDPARSDVNRGHVISNNKIEFSGMHSSYSSGIYMMFTGHNDVSHNLVRYAPRWLIGGGTWTTTAAADNYFENNYFGYNDLYRSSEDTADSASFYFFGSVAQPEANIVEQLRVTTARWNAGAGLSESAPSGQQPNLGAWGVYFDNESNWWAAKNIAVSDAQTAPYLSNGTNQTLTNVSWGSGYDSSKIDAANIGLLPDFPQAYGNGGVAWINDSDSGFVYAGAWDYVSGSAVAADFASDEHYSNTAGASVTRSFTGTTAAWIASVSNNRGMADVYIDGTLDATVDLYSATTLRQARVYTKTGLTSGTHEIKIVVRSDKNASSDGTYVTVDGVGVATDLINDTAFTYTGSWHANSGLSGNYLGDEKYSNATGDAAQATFAGTEVNWLASTANNRGKADVFIDGVFDVTVDLYTSVVVRQNAVYHRSGLAAGSHTIRVVVRPDHNPSSGGNYVTIDGLRIVP